MLNHVHMLVTIPSKIRVSSSMEFEISADDYRPICKSEVYVWEQSFLDGRYSVSAIGLNESNMRKYIQNQDREDIMKARSTEILSRVKGEAV